MFENTWKNHFEYSFDDRVILMANIINWDEVASIIDLGCGKQDLLKYINSTNDFDIDYTGIDIYQHCASTIIKDFNKKEIINKKADVCFCSGIFEYIYDIPFFVNDIAKSCDVLIGSYHFEEEWKDRHELWVNSVCKHDFFKLFLDSGFKIKTTFLANATETIFVLYKPKFDDYIDKKYINLMRKKKFLLELKSGFYFKMYKITNNKKYYNKAIKLDEAIRKVRLDK